MDEKLPAEQHSAGRKKAPSAWEQAALYDDKLFLLNIRL